MADKAKSGRLSTREKQFIVTRLAVFDTPSQAAKAFEEQFGRKISPQGCWIYDAGNDELRGRISKELCEMFDRVRSRFVKAVEDVPIANKAFRLKVVGDLVMAELGKDKPNKPWVLQALEQAAKECGDVFTNKQEVSGPGGGPVAVSHGYDLSKLDMGSLKDLKTLLSTAHVANSG